MTYALTWKRGISEPCKLLCTFAHLAPDSPSKNLPGIELFCDVSLLPKSQEEIYSLPTLLPEAHGPQSLAPPLSPTQFFSPLLAIHLFIPQDTCAGPPVPLQVAFPLPAALLAFLVT